jgi:Flp pilus assembly protein TadG
MNNQSQVKPALNPLKRGLNRVATTIRELIGARQGAIGVALALLFVPTVMVVGAAVDYARLEQFKTQLQATVDAAALSGAAAYVDASASTTASTVATNYMTSNDGLLPSHVGTITDHISVAQVTTGSNQGYTVTVTATATIGTTFMRLVSPTLNVSASATAVNPILTITLTANNFRAAAWDANTLWYWLISASAPTAVPNPNNFASSQKLASNTTTNNSSVTFTASATQEIGLALQNVTGGEGGWYGCTQYEVASGYTDQAQCYLHTQWFFSNIYPPSNNSYNLSGYKAVTTNCSVMTALTATLPTSLTPPAGGSCYTSLPAYSVFSCNMLNSQYLTFYWNDMGGGTDDKDYNDAELSISCSGSIGNTATGVYLSS